MLRALTHQLAFFREFRQRFETTGSFVPSSGTLARAMTRYLAARDPARPVRVLEIGPGTGPVTDAIVRLIRPGDTFDLVELNAAFVQILHERFEREDAWRAAAPVSTIHQLPIQEFKGGERYDFVISGLPLNNFPADLVESITGHYFELLKTDGVLSYFEYMFVRPVRMRVARGEERERIARIDDIMRGHCERHRIRRDDVWWNVPPAWVQHLRGAGRN